MSEANLETATLAAGCFWCVEAVFDDLKGVEELEQEGVVIAVRGKRYSLLEFTPYHAGQIRVNSRSE